MEETRQLHQHLERLQKEQEKHLSEIKERLKEEGQAAGHRMASIDGSLVSDFLRAQRSVVGSIVLVDAFFRNEWQKSFCRRPVIGELVRSRPLGRVAPVSRTAAAL